MRSLSFAAWLWFGALVGAPAQAATYDPQLTWRTIVTEHFRIHFHQGEEQLAEELSQMVERVYDTMTTEMAWKARMRTDVVLIDRTDRANGFATAVPYNAITIFVTAPQEDSTLSLYEDWSEAIFTHELTHVLHLETHGGIVGVARAVVGRIASTNTVSPWWMVEGLATLQETRHTPGGRGRSPYVDMIKRTAVLEDAFPPLGNMDGFQPDPPAGNLRYLFGQDFMQYIADHTGEDVWTRWTHAYGRSVPWALFLLPPKRVFGARIQKLYGDWKAHSFAHYEAQADTIRAEGVREGRIISDGVADCTAPSFAPDDSMMVWSCYDRRTGSALWRAEADGSGPEILKQDFGAKTFTWRSDSKAFVYAATHIVNRFNTWSDIYLFDVASKSVKSLTRGARARDPDFSPDGAHLAMVTNRSQDTELEVLTVDQRRTPLTQGADHVQYATPRYAPSGKVMAVSVWEQGRRDLWILDAQGQRLRRLTADLANDRDPMWSSDGRWLYFSSDRSGVPNIYAIDVQTEHLWQVTNVLTGAARPSVNAQGTLLAYEQYSENGFDVRLMPLDPADFLDRGLLPAPFDATQRLVDLVQPLDAPRAPDLALAARWQGEPLGPMAAPPRHAEAHAHRPQDSDAIDTFEQIEVKDAFGEEQDYPFTIKPRRYNPMPSLLPRYWLPTFGVTPRLPGPAPHDVSQWFNDLPAPFTFGGFSFGASTAATDPLRRYGYSGWASYRSDANDWGGGVSFTLNHWLPVFSLSVSTRVNPYTYLRTSPWQPVGEDGEPDFTSADVRTVFMRETGGTLAVSYPFTARHTFFANYTFTWRTLRDGLDAFAYEPSLALRGTIGDLTAGYAYSWGQPTAYAISAEDARSLVLSARVTAPWLGTFSVAEDGEQTGVTQVLVSLDWREYIVNPLAPNHVFALRGGAGVAFGGDDRFLGNFQLGGNGLGAARALRGYPFGADRGDSFWLAGAEYRLPLWRIDRGFGTVPAFFRVLHGAVFVEAGNAFDGLTDFVDLFDDTLVGVGAELRLSTLLLWAGSVDLRLGYAVGITQDGYGFDDPRTVYFLVSGNL